MAESWLPMDILVEILIRLPVKSILQLRCVSKTWRDLISSPLFIDSHLKSDRKQSVVLVKRFLPPPNGGQTLSFHDSNSPGSLVSPNLPIPTDNGMSNRPNDTFVPIYGPCNGLVCIPLEQGVFLCNPALREFKLLPPLKLPEFSHPLGYGFWFDRIGGVYKVIQIWSDQPPGFIGLSYGPEADALYDTEAADICEIQVDLYDSASNSLKRLDAPVAYIKDPPGVGLFTNGAIHWCAVTAMEDHPCILCFDTSSEAFQKLDLHDDIRPVHERWPRLMEVDGSLAMAVWSSTTDQPFSDIDIEIWVMKEYGVKESWTKQFVIHTQPCSPLLYLNKWLLSVINYTQLAACEIHGQQDLEDLEFYGLHDSISAVVYDESLISLKDI